MPKPTRPTSVTVGHATYDIRWIEETPWMKEFAAQADKGGFFWVDGNVICMRTQNEGDDRHDDSLRETLLHEILHACWHHTNMAHHGAVEKDDLEEWVVGTLSFPLIAVLRANPDLVRWLLG